MKTRKKSERRTQPRHVFQLPALVKHGDGGRRSTATITTRDISSGGIFFFAGTKVKKGSEIDLILVMPPEIKRFAHRWVCCQATVVRVERKRRQFGVAARIARCEALPMAESQ
ncbi:MAG TPA: PilZ domain-containing protein [Terriglobales bacterium]|nr:PilZ domain-containing protein [Terriglobales bacterium]